MCEFQYSQHRRHWAGVGECAVRQEFLVAFDYGQGGLWAFMTADSEDQIRARYPGLVIVTDRPDWLHGELERRLRETASLDVDDESDPFIRALIGSSPAGDS